MQRVPDQFGFYGILTNPVRGYEYLTKLLVDHEVAFIQLRMKNKIEKEVEAMAEKLRTITLGTKSRFIINDYPGIAARVEADGVHVGQGDMPYEQVREIVGPDRIVGLSTHNPQQTRDACAKKPDYIGVGPVFPTPTKKIADPPIGIEGMQEMLGHATVPAVVLGAIDSNNLNEVLRAGAGNFSLVRPLNCSEEPEKDLREILKIYREL